MNTAVNESIPPSISAPDMGVSVSFSGCLIENLNNLANYSNQNQVGASLLCQFTLDFDFVIDDCSMGTFRIGTRLMLGAEPLKRRLEVSPEWTSQRLATITLWLL